MATMSQTWSMFTVAAVLASVHLSRGEKSCDIWSSSGTTKVQRDSSFKVYCKFKPNNTCGRSMYSGHPPIPLKSERLNASTLYFNVVNIRKNTTYSCQCSTSPATLDPCGLDISAGYPPDRPKNLSCIHKVLNNESGDVVCAWNRGRNTYFRTTSVLWMRTGNRSFRTDLPSASFRVSRTDHQFISVWVSASNPLGTNMSAIINYTLSDIAMPPPPVFSRPKCSSRECVIKVEQTVRTLHLEIQYRTEQQTWTTHPDSGVQASLVQVRSVSCLEPYRLYHFRARSKFSTGLWSQWSANISSWTQEEAPAKQLDVWYAESDSDSKSLTVFWKDTPVSIARGKILEYNITVNSADSGLVLINNISAQARNYSIPFCAKCEVTVCARNSRGLSPPARITTHHTKAEPPQDVRVMTRSHNVTISWSVPETAPPPAAYLVEWYPDGHKLEELRWVRLGGNDSHAVLTGIKPLECYKGAVYMLYNDSSVTSTSFAGDGAMESAPAAGPLVQEKVEGDTVEVTWTELPRNQRHGCITNYTIYLQNSSGHQQLYFIQASKRTCIIKALSPALYILWMTAWTSKGEGPAGPKVKFFIQQSTQLPPLLVGTVVAFLLLFLVCLWQNSAVKQRFWVFFQCFMLDVVPDPANSKWAKECTRETGRMNLQLQLSNSSVTDEEDEPILVDVEELPERSSDISTQTNVSSRLPSQTSGTGTERNTLLYPLTAYIKSFSHDSDSSDDHTHTSLDTNTTVDYISSAGPGNLDEEDQEEDRLDEEEEEFGGVLGFFPSHNVFMEPLVLGGKLTLDAVKIDCGDFFQDS